MGLGGESWGSGKRKCEGRLGVEWGIRERKRKGFTIRINSIKKVNFLRNGLKNQTI